MEIAKHVFGQGRSRWEWAGKLFTAAGVEVPNQVMVEDSEIIRNGEAIAPDEQVLDMKVTLPAEALPHPYQLASDEPPPAVEEVPPDVTPTPPIAEPTPEPTGKKTAKGTSKKAR